MKTLYIDESGSYSNDVKKLNPDNPIFLLAGVIIDRKSNNELTKEFKKIKKKFFQREDIVFHSREFSNPTKSKQPGIIQFSDVKFREKFYFDLNKVITKIDFKLCGFTVYVPEYLKVLKANQPDPYVLGVEIVTDTFMENLSKNETGKIIAEARSHQKLNKTVLDRWKMEFETHNRVGLTKASDLIHHCINEPEFIEKDSSVSGLELVDLVAYHFARGLANKPPKGPQNEIPIDLINLKITKYFALPAHPSYYIKK